MQDNNAMFADGAAYERLMGRWSQKIGQHFLDWLAATPGKDWLDVGCGNGAFTEIIQAHSAPARLAGLDASESQIAYARQREGCNAAAFQVGDAQNLAFPDASFDVSVMALVIAFLPEPARAVAELARVTRPGGTCACYMWDLPSGVPTFPLYRELAALGHVAPMPPSAKISSCAALQQLWQDAGLEAVEVQTFTTPVVFHDFEDFWASNSGSVGPQAAMLNALSDADRSNLRAALRQKLPTDTAGRIAYSATANAVKGRRAG